MKTTESHRAACECDPCALRKAFASGVKPPDDLVKRRDIDADKARKKHRSEVFDRDGGVCQLCLSAVDPNHADKSLRLALDHVIPWRQGGTDDPDNLQLVHWVCNSRKGSRLVESETICREITERAMWLKHSTDLDSAIAAARSTPTDICGEAGYTGGGRDPYASRCMLATGHSEPHLPWYPDRRELKEFDGRWANGPQYDYSPPPICDRVSIEFGVTCHLPVWHNGACEGTKTVLFLDGAETRFLLHGTETSVREAWSAEKGWLFKR